ncbi:MAG: M61 family metallopeptidase [Ottowia sp.]|nr:M61 family metallopeptidase [Ottowia sp.]
MTNAAAPSPAVRYVVRAAIPAAHRWQVEMHIAQPHAGQRVSLPVWAPGSYLVREFSRFLDGLHAECDGKPCALERVNKNTWALHGAAGQPVVLRYEVYAFDASPRGAWLDAERGFFSGTALLLRAHGADELPHALEVLAPPEAPDWSAAVALEAATADSVDARGFGTYGAPSYEALVDAPLVMGRLWQGSFEAGGVTHRFAITGATPAFDGARLLRDAQTICQTAIAMWQTPGNSAPPFSSYLFILHVGGDGGLGGLEHANCCALGCGRQNLPRLHAEAEHAPSEGYLRLLGLISHEYFHAWCVKRLRPFEEYDFECENLTELLWFFEGFTTYYEDIVLRRAGLLSDAGYLQRLLQHIEHLQRSPGRLRQSVAQASYDAWLRFYRPDENTPNSTVNYYAKGALVALCLDLTLRAEGRGTLDDAMRALWQRHTVAPDVALREADITVALAQAGGRSFEKELAAWVHGTDELPVESLLAGCGVRVRRHAASVAQALGVAVREEGGCVTVSKVLDGSAAARAGLQAGDEWLAVQQAEDNEGVGDFWRIRQLKEVMLYAHPGQRVLALVARDGRLCHLLLTLPPAGSPQTQRWELVPPPPDVGDWPGA